MQTKTCFFIGHRDTPREIFRPLRDAVETHIVQHSVSEFIVGGYGEFDRLAAMAVIDAKRVHSHVSLLLLLPYHPALRPVNTPEGFDGTFHPEGMEKVPHRLAIIRANEYAINSSDFLIAYACYPSGNARKLVEYALRREKKDLIKVQNLTLTAARHP